MLVAAYCLAYKGEQLLAVIILAIFSAVATLSILTWMLRDRIAPFVAYMTLLGSLAIAIPTVWLIVSRSASAESLAFMNWPQSNWSALPAIFIAPLVIGWFCFLEYCQTAPKAPRAGTSERIE